MTISVANLAESKIIYFMACLKGGVNYLECINQGRKKTLPGRYVESGMRWRKQAGTFLSAPCLRMQHDQLLDFLAWMHYTLNCIRKIHTSTIHPSFLKLFSVKYCITATEP